MTRSDPSAVRQVLLHPDAARPLTLADGGPPLDGLTVRPLSQLARNRYCTVGWPALCPGTSLGLLPEVRA